MIRDDWPYTVKDPCEACPLPLGCYQCERCRFNEDMWMGFPEPSPFERVMQEYNSDAAEEVRFDKAGFQRLGHDDEIQVTWAILCEGPDGKPYEVARMARADEAVAFAHCQKMRHTVKPVFLHPLPEGMDDFPF